jgi:probable HAF family extracellular repeat protein
MQKRTWKWTLVAALALVGVGVVLAGVALAKKPTPPPTPQPPPPPPISYSLTWIGDLGFGSSTPNNINANGDVVGGSPVTSGNVHAFLYTDATGIVDLNTLIDPTSGWFLAHARDVNDSRQVVGLGTRNGVAALYRLTFVAGSQWGEVEHLAVPAGETAGDMHCINNFGEACGFTKSEGYNHACYWSAPDSPVLIFPDHRFSEAYGINDAGQVVGVYLDPVTSFELAFRWTPDGTWQSFGPIHMPRSGTYRAQALAVNDHGSFTGTATDVDGRGNSIGYRALRYTDGIGMIDLCPYAAANGGGYGRSINNNGDVVGLVYIWGTSGTPTHFVYTDAWGLRSLDALVPGGIGSTYINDSGQITGLARSGEGFLLTPIWP